MWPFRRRKNTANPPIPSEVRDYYQSARRERMGIAWLIAFLSLLLTVIVVLGLFLGSRWLYRKITNNDQPQTTQQTTDNKPKDSIQKAEGDQQSTPSNGTAQTPTSTPTGTTTTPTTPPITDPSLLRTGPDSDE